MRSRLLTSILGALTVIIAFSAFALSPPARTRDGTAVNLNTIKKSSAQSQLVLTWFGASTVFLGDGKTGLLFDPFFSRPSFSRVSLLRSLKSDSSSVDLWLQRGGVENVKAIFVSHTHYDHTLDLVRTTNKLNAMVYASKSAKNILIGGNVQRKLFRHFKFGQSVQVGGFKITALEGVHAPHFWGMTLFSGPIKEPVKSDGSVMSYGMGDNYNYLIEHPLGRILFHPGSHSKGNIGHQVDIVIQGIAKRESSQDIIEKILKPSGAKTVIPVHFDDIFLPLHEPLQYLSGVDLAEFQTTVAKEIPQIYLRVLKRGVRTTLP